MFLLFKRRSDRAIRKKNEAELALNKIAIEMSKRLDDSEERMSTMERERDNIQSEAQELLRSTLLNARKLDMNMIRTSVDIVYRGFGSRIMGCQYLTDKEKDFCLLYRIGLAPKVIAALSEISLSRVYSRKSEITSKLVAASVITPQEDDDFDVVLDAFGKR